MAPRPRPSAAFTVADIRRAVKAVRSSGERVAGVDFPAEGGFRVLIGEPMASPPPLPAVGPGGRNEWDEVLPH